MSSWQMTHNRLTEPRGFRDVQHWVWLFHIFSLSQTCVLQQKHQLEALSAHISSIDLEKMQKTSFSRWWSITQPAPMTPKLYTKVVFTQQIKRRLQLKTFFISTVIIVSKSFGVISMFVYKRQLLLFSIGQRARLVAKVVSRWKPCCHNKWPAIFYIFCDRKGSDFVDDGEDLLVLVGKWADPGGTAMPGQPVTRPEQAPEPHPLAKISLISKGAHGPRIRY